MLREFRLTKIDDYEEYIGSEAVERIRSKAEELQNAHVAHINSTYYGGGVAELLSSLTLLMNSVGIRTGWRVIQGSPDYFSITKKMHNALNGAEINLSERKKDIYQDVVYGNAMRNHLDHDFIIVHDPQPLPIIRHYEKKGPWIWRCHLELSTPDDGLWEYLTPFIEAYDAVVLSLQAYRRKLDTPQVFIMPAIDPFSIKNRVLSENEKDERLAHYDIPSDLPLVTQISRFDRWKDPHGVIEAFKKARKEIDARLVLLGNVATDDPEGDEVYQSLLDEQSDDIIILSQQDSALVNALQCRSTVVLQKSIREGFGLTVAEAMWKGTPVIGGNCGGIRCQIEDGETGYLVDSIDEAAERIVELVRQPEKAKKMGERAKEKVKKDLLLTRLLENYLDLLNGFETRFLLEGAPKASGECD
ncbi:MAG: glycosyltransferase [Candidatus Eisenbacteria bacterium]|nr:glycosyltransferase [Candidatus Eisenbacteria bacterium]